jgi:biopolymer transport protein ExbB
VPTLALSRDAGPVGKGSILRLFARANPMVWLLAVCSVVTLGYALERLVALRRERVIPRDFVNRFLERLASGKLDRDRAAELCRANDSAVARVFAMAVSYWGQPATTIRQAIGYDAAGELSDLKRNVRVLNGTATLAPLLGLLGTVIGMIQSFDALGGRVGPNKGELLAQGISLALVTTALGLAIAVVSVAAYYFLLNKVDVLVRDLDEHARQVIDLVSAEAVRPATDRRPNLAASGDHAPRHETRIH